MDWSLLRAYGFLLASALGPIHLGALASVKARKAPRKDHREQDGSDSDEDDDMEAINSSDALWFPVVASIALGSLYLAFKYLDKDLVNKILGACLHLVGLAGFVRMLVVLTQRYYGKAAWSTFTKYKLALSRLPNKSITSLRFTYYHLAFIVISIVATIAHAYTKNWVLSNVFGTVYSFNAISLLRLDSFRTGILLLAGLFFYDIVMVFYSPMMVSVAQNFEAPVKMVFPKDLQAESLAFAMLGLGDIVMPGIFLALALRFDYHLATKNSKKDSSGHLLSNYPKRYYRICFIAYILALVLCIFVMHFFQHAQPALLYLSPACSLSVVVLALVRGEAAEFWRFVDSSSPLATDDSLPSKNKEESKKDL